MANISSNPDEMAPAKRTLVFQLGDVHLGAVGPKGGRGIQGRPGKTGRPGTAGKDGDPGLQGDPGKQGIQGVAGGGVQNFLGLTDTPSDYIADGHKLTRVNAAASAVEYTDSINAGSF